MHGEQQGRNRRDDFWPRDRRPEPATVLGCSPDEQTEQADIDHVEQDIRETESERAAPPHHAIERIRNDRHRPRGVVPDEHAQIRRIGHRPVFDDDAVVVVDERIVQRVRVHQAGEDDRQPARDTGGARSDWVHHAFGGYSLSPLRILHVTPYGEDAWAYGGIPRVAAAFVRQLAAFGHDVTVCTTDAGDATHRLTDPGPRGERISVRVFPNRSNRLAHDWQWFTPVGLHAYLAEHARDFDVAHLHACRNFPGAIAAHHLRRYGVPYVIGPNGTAPAIERRHAAKYVFDAVAGRRMLREAAAVLAVSDAERRDLLALGIPDTRIQLVPNPVDLSEFSPAIGPGLFRRKHGLQSEPLVVLLAKITPRKRLDVLTRAFAAMADRWPLARLVIAGNDMGGLEQALRLARSLGAADRVIVTGLLAGRERLELLADATVVVYPSEREVFGLVPLEAILAGAPVIVTGDSGCGEIVTSVAGGGVVPAGDVPALVAALADVLASPDVWRATAGRAASLVRQRYGSATVTERLVQVYADVVRPARATHVAAAQIGVSFVVPVKNGMATIAATIASIERQADGRPFEIIVIDDRSTDGSSKWLGDCVDAGRIRLIAGAGRGPSAAMNLGVGVARYPVICQVDQDVELLPGWLTHVVAPLEHDARIGAVQGQYTTDGRAPAIARAMGLDLEQRYIAIENGITGHVCTGNTAYRASALREAGLFDEALGYGNDNDMSYRLHSRGWRLAHCRQARSVHRWRESFRSYCRQQFGLGYGRLDVVARHPRRITGDSVSPTAMMLHPLLMLAALTCLAFAGVVAVAGVSAVAARTLTMTGALLVASLFAERAIAGVRAWWRFSDPAALLFPIVHLARDLAWVAAIAVWTARRAMRRDPRPSHSMPNAATTSGGLHTVMTRGGLTPAHYWAPRPARVLGIIPAHNEAATLAAVIADVRAECPDLDLLVVDDGSSDGSDDLLPRLGVRWLRLPERMGIGCAMRAGLRYARRLGYDSVVRIDGDGQHRAQDIAFVLEPLHAGVADVVLGSRFLPGHSGRPDTRIAHRLLGLCLSWLTRRSVTDPTSGFCALGPRAVRLLATHHPTGYPEAELRLFLSRNELVSVEVAVGSRARMGGHTTLTPARIVGASARVLLAMLIVPLRRGAPVADRE